MRKHPGIVLTDMTDNTELKEGKDYTLRIDKKRNQWTVSIKKKQASVSFTLRDAGVLKYAATVIK